MKKPIEPQSESVVKNDNPHGDTKLSSAHGTTQEREHETLAEGRPGSRRPISEAGRPRNRGR
jgi:hypothetical protein